MIDLGRCATHPEQLHTSIAEVCKFFCEVFAGCYATPVYFILENVTLSLLFLRRYTSQVFLFGWPQKMSPFGGLSNKDLILFFTFPRTVSSRVPCCFPLEALHLSSSFSFSWLGPENVSFRWVS